jgi:hypothetical protein
MIPEPKVLRPHGFVTPYGKVGGVSTAARQNSVPVGPHMRGFTTPRSISSKLIGKVNEGHVVAPSKRNLYHECISGTELYLLKDGERTLCSRQFCCLSAIELLPTQEFELTPALNEVHFGDRMPL